MGTHWATTSRQWRGPSPGRLAGSAGGGDPGDRPAYWMWSVLVESRKAYTEKYVDPAALSASRATNPLDGLDWHDARNQRGDNFTYQGIKFSTSGRVLHRRTAKGRWVPQTAVASQPSKRCPGLGLNEEAAGHWHFQFPNWSLAPGPGTWGWAPGSFGVRPGEGVGVVGVPETMGTGRFRVAALAETAARSGVCPDDPATVAMRSWASRTTRRYHGSLLAVADFEDERTLPTGPSTCLSEYLSAKVSSGGARWTLRNVVSTVRRAENLGLMPPTVLRIHSRLAKGGLWSGRHPYFSPPALSFLAQAARTREQRIALGLGCVSCVL